MSKVVCHCRDKKEPTRKHNHLPSGKTGYIPHGVGVTDLSILKR